MIETVKTVSFEEEYIKTCQSPMLFVCRTNSGLQKYYVKYIHEDNEFDCLVYEMVCQRLARYFNINTPDIALVDVIQDSFDYKDIQKNRIFFHPGVTAFGSKEVERTTLITRIDTIPDKYTFNTYANPLDLIKICLFDLHLDNRDRTEQNFNLLRTRTGLSEFYVFDHYECFGGVSHLGRISPSVPFNIHATIGHSNFSTQMLKYLELPDILRVVDNYKYLCNPLALQQVVDEIFTYIPADWAISANLNEKIKAFVCDVNRLNDIIKKVTDLFIILKAKAK